MALQEIEAFLKPELVCVKVLRIFNIYPTQADIFLQNHSFINSGITIVSVVLLFFKEHILRIEVRKVVKTLLLADFLERLRA